MLGRSLLFQVWFDAVTQKSFNLWWAWNQVTPVWWLDIRLFISLLAPGWQSILFLLTYLSWFMGKVSSPIHFPLEPGCVDYSFLDQAVADFEQSLDSILTDSIKIPELDASFEEPDCVPSSVSSGILCMVNTISDTSKPQLAHSIKSHKFWCQATTLLSHVPIVARYQHVNLFDIFQSSSSVWVPIFFTTR